VNVADLRARLTAVEAVELDHVRRRWEAADREALNRLWKAMVLSPTIEVCEALLRGEAVPVDRLDPAWALRFGLRETP
jgi:hypothetical protein